MVYLLLTFIIYPFLWIYFLYRKRTLKIKRILVIQTAKIGDFICSTHIFREIKKRYKDVKLSVMVSKVNEELAKLNPYIDEVITIEVKQFKGLLGKIKLSKIIRKGRYDVGITLNPNLLTAISLVWGLVPIRISVLPNFCGITFKAASRFFTHLIPHLRGKLVIKTFAETLNPLGIEVFNLDKEVYKSEEAEGKVKDFIKKFIRDAEKPLIGIIVSSGNKLKELDTESLVEIIRKLLEETEAYLVLIGSDKDKKKANEILSLIKERERVIEAVGVFKLSELPALVEKLSVIVGVDTGIVYMADALSVPIVHISGPIDISEQRPVGKKVITINPRKLPCAPCSFVFKTSYICKTGERKCIKDLKIDEVVEATKKLISLK